MGKWFSQERYGKFLKDEYAQGHKFLGLKAVEPGVENMFTGLKPTKAAAALAVTGLLAYGAVKTAWDTTVERKQRVMSKAEDVGTLPSLGYDAVGNVSGGKRDLGATGDMVFGMYNARKG